MTLGCTRAQFGRMPVSFVEWKFRTVDLYPYPSGRAPDGQACSRLNGCFQGTKGCFLTRTARNEQNVIALKRDVWFLPVENVLNIHGHLFTLIGVALQSQDSGMPCISSAIEPLGERERLERRDGLVFAENESTRAPHLANHIHHFRLWDRDDVMRKNLNVFFGLFGLHNLLQVDLGDAEPARRIQCRARQWNAAPLNLPADANTVPGVRSNPPGQR